MWKLLVIALVIAALGGCQTAEPTPAASAGTASSAVDPSAGSRGGLDHVNRLALGTLNLEGTADAVTSAQATELLPLWRIIQGGTLKSTAEIGAVTKQIEGKMTTSQLAAIEAMELTGEDMQAWMQEQGIEMPTGNLAGQGRADAPGNLSEDERAQMREQFQDMTPEQRATRMAEMGVEVPEGGTGGARPGPFGGRQVNFILEPLTALLSGRASG
jgi:hypothetical protein